MSTSRLVLLCFVLALSFEAGAATFTVVNTSDAGPGSLRQALTDANANPGLDRVEFNIPGGGGATIAPGSNLPFLTDPVVIDGTTQPGFAGAPIIELSGAGAGIDADGLVDLIGGCVIRGLVINGYDDYGITLEGVGRTVIAGNYLGTDRTGTISVPNGEAGVGVFDSAHNIIGGKTAADRNLISGAQTVGIFILGEPAVGNVIIGNYIGTDVTGTVALGSLFDGICISDAAFTTVGGTNSSCRNVISGQGFSGVYIFGDTAVSNVVQGNFLGTDVTGTVAIPNVADGVTIDLGSYNLVGGSEPGAGNVLSGNDESGVYIARAANNRVQGNFIGSDVTGTVELSNGYDGVILEDAVSNLIGGTEPGAGNLLSGNFLSGIAIMDCPAPGNVVQGNLIGTSVTGNDPLPNGVVGVDIIDSSGNLIGGTTPGARNVVSSNPQLGIYLFGTNAVANWVQGNFIGLGKDGLTPLGNGDDGVYVEAPFNFIGGTAPGAGNVISANGDSGILIHGTIGNSNIVQGNFIGTDSTGTVALGNRFDGVTIQDGAGNWIGGSAPGAGNLISGNEDGGVYIGRPTARYNVVQGNRIGTALNGMDPLSNDEHGVLVEFGASDNWIGGIGPGEGNIVAYVTRVGFDGVRIREGINNSVRGNSIFMNVGLGICLGDDGIGFNDPDDADIGANGLQNFPVITSAVTTTSTAISGTLHSKASRPFAIDFYANPACHPSGRGEGMLYIGSADVTTDSSGNVGFGPIVFPAVPAGYVLSATATDGDGNTSEFCECVTVSGANPSADLQIGKSDSPIPALAGEPLIYEITVENLGTDDASNVRVRESFPEGTAFGSSSLPPVSLFGSTLTFDLGTFVAGSNLVFTVEVIPTRVGSITNRIEVSALTWDPSLANNSTNLVSVVDTRQPTIACPPDLTVECGVSGGAMVWFSPVVTGFQPMVTCAPASGSFFALGATPVECMVEDPAGKTAMCGFNVTVVDTTPPSIICPTNMILSCTSSSGATATFSPSATDVCDPNPTVSCTPMSGSFFGLGTTVVTCEAVDMNGNVGSCSFGVTVTQPFVIQTLPGRLRTDFTGHVGMKITTGTNRLCVTELGLISIPNNTGNNPVKIVRASDLAEMGSVSVPAGGGVSGSYNFATLPQVVVLETNTMYYLVMFVQFGEKFYDVNSTALTTDAAELTSSVYQGSGHAWSTGPSGNQTYGVPNLKYYVAPPGSPVTPPPATPAIALTAPENGITFAAPATFTVEATTSEEITMVEFFQKGVSLGVDSTAPFSVEAANLAPGNYRYRARGTTATGASVISDVLSVSVTANLATTNPCFVTNIVLLGRARTDFTGWVGKRITVGFNSIEVTHLGRFVLPGNTGLHTVKLVDAATLIDIPLSLAAVPTQGGPVNDFKFVELATPVLLQPGRTYYLVSKEFVAQDAFADVNSVIETTGVASCDGPVWFSDALGWNEVSVDQTYGPVSFKYRFGPPPTKQLTLTQPADGAVITVPAVVPIEAMASPDLVKVEFFANEVKLGEDTTAPFSLLWTNPSPRNYRLTAVGMDGGGMSVTSLLVNVTIQTAPAGTNCLVVSKTLGGQRNDFTGWVGYKFTTGPNDLQAVRLGRIVAPGNSQSHTVKVVVASSLVDLPGAEVVLIPAGGVVGEFKYQTLSSPVTLVANTAYYLVSSETKGGDAWFDVRSTVVNGGPSAAINSGVYNSVSQGWNLAGLPNRGYVPLDIKFSVSGGAQPFGSPIPALSVPPSLAGQIVDGSMVLTLNGITGQPCILEASQDLNTWTKLAEHVLERDQVKLADIDDNLTGWRFYRVVVGE